MKVRNYDKYEEYIEFQSKKTLDPVRREKWLGQEWQSKIDGFKQEFSKFNSFLNENTKCLCLGARTGQEVVALKEMGIKEVVGIDIVPCEPHVIEGDIHNLTYEDDTFDFVYTNIIDHSIDPKKMVSEIERVLKNNGIFFLQVQLGLNQDEFTEFVIENPIYDIVTLFDQSYCVALRPVNENQQSNFAGMNYELVFVKNERLSTLYKKYGNVQTIQVPEGYEEIWNKINEPIQNKKLDQNNITDENERNNILSGLRKRAYYLTRVAEVFNAKKIAEVGTAEGWQFFSFGRYCKEVSGKVFSCDPRDVRSSEFVSEYDEFCNFTLGTSKEMSENVECTDIDLFYIDGMHQENSVLTDIFHLEKTQSDSPVWIFDDFDVRFGCFKDIVKVINVSPRGFKIWNIGLTASGNPSHQVLVENRFVVNAN
jgi:SAM-dependent methyltransferase